jgi:opacity protein-like surface antigen
MRKLLLATTCAIGAGSAPTWAADLPVKAPRTLPPPIFSWTGCYIGANVAGGWGSKDFTDTFFTPGFLLVREPPSSPRASTGGGLAGGQVGCNYQFATNWVVGFEGAGDWANINGSSDPFFGGKAVFNASTHWIATATVRLGYTFNDLLIYAKGGGAWAGDKYSMPGTFSGFPFDFVGSETRSGFTVGGGVEWAFWQTWSANLEYAYYDFGTHSLNLIDSGIIGANFGPDPSSIRQRIQTLKFGVNYHFWNGAPRY